MTRSFYIALLACLFCLADATAQRRANRDFGNGLQLSAKLQMGLPQNEFNEVFNGYPTGIGLSALLPVGKAKLLRFGAEYAWGNMGRETSLVEIQNDIQGVIAGDLTIQSKLYAGHAIIRFDPFDGAIRPYFDVFFGMRKYETDSSLEVENTDGSIITQSSNIQDDWTNSYGFSGGLMIAIGRHVFIDGQLQMQRGGEVEYVNQSALTIDTDGGLNFRIEETPTDMLVPQVGLTVVF